MTEVIVFGCFTRNPSTPCEIISGMPVIIFIIYIFVTSGEIYVCIYVIILCMTLYFTCYVRRYHGYPIRHSFADHHRGHFIYWCKQKHISVAVVLVDICCHIDDFDSRVIADSSLNLFNIPYLIITSVPIIYHKDFCSSLSFSIVDRRSNVKNFEPGSNDLKSDIIASLSELLKYLHRPNLILSWAYDSKRQNIECIAWDWGGTFLTRALSSSRVFPNWRWHSNIDYRRRSGWGIQSHLFLANEHYTSSISHCTLDHINCHSTDIPDRQVLSNHLVVPPFVDNPYRWMRSQGHLDDIRGSHDGIADNTEYVSDIFDKIE